MKLEEGYQKVVEKAWSDSKYKQRLLGNPRDAIKEVTGFSPPDSVKLFVHEITSDTQHFILPQNPKDALKSELSDVELEQVAGGKGPQIIKPICSANNIGSFIKNALLIPTGHSHIWK
jgi:hypothetical protein